MSILNIVKSACGYGGEDPFQISISDIELHKGSLYFLLGKSGSGKSTFLEAIGLMNRTFSDKASYDVTFTISDSDSIDIRNLWDDENKLSKFRSDNLSFIFQTTNLMDNFTVGENMSFGLLLSGKNSEQSKDKILPLMMSIDLPHEIYDKKVQNLSGGQRQRVAFVRALTAPFEVMFCDEPTGNLDPVVANKLMTTLKGNIVEANKTAIIVSHSIDLAVAYADHIVVITPGDNSNGLIEPKFIYDRVGETWQNHSGQEMMDFEKFLTQQIS